MGKQSVIRSAENNLQQFCHDAPGLFWGSLSLNLACHCLAILEVYLVLHFMRSSGQLGAFVSRSSNQADQCRRNLQSGKRRDL